jgi:DNA invertase Pin-like site-specific DNA recombinase
MSSAAVLYAAKSTADERGSIPTQLADCRAAAKTEGREIVAEHSDEAASAYKGNRGSGLTAAKDTAIAAGAELWVQHSDRLARGDGITADHLAEVWFALRRHGVRIRSVQDDSNLEDAIRVVLIGERNHEDSKRKSAATRAGLKRRADRGKPVGAVPEGYRVEATVRDGRAHSERVIDPQRRQIVDRIMDSVEVGHTFGDVARALNADGLRTRRGKPWEARAVRRIVLNEDYTGTTDYPQLIDPDRHARILAGLPTLGPRRRPAGRRPAEDYLLRGIAVCGRCGATMYTRNLASGRHYICRHVRQASGLCDLPAIPAAIPEGDLFHHLDRFVQDARGWLEQQAGKANAERDRFADAVNQQRGEVRKLQVRAQRARETYEKLLDAGDDLALAALREGDRMDTEAEAARQALQAAQTRLDEWQAPDVDAGLELYGRLRELVHGRVVNANGAPEMAAALRSVLTALTLDVVDGKAPDPRGQYRPATMAAGVLRWVRMQPYLRTPDQAAASWWLSGPLGELEHVQRSEPGWLENGPQTFV